MDSAPTMSSVTPTATNVVSMIEVNGTALRSIRFLNWARARSQIAVVISGVNFANEASTP